MAPQNTGKEVTGKPTRGRWNERSKPKLIRPLLQGTKALKSPKPSHMTKMAMEE